MSQKKYIVRLGTTEREELQKLINKRSSRSQQVRRAYVILAADADGTHGWTDEQLSTSYGMPIRTVERLRQRVVEEGLQRTIEGKKPEPRSSRMIDGEVEAHLVALRCSPAPEGYSRWSLRLLADKMVELQYVNHISHEAVRQVLKKTRSSRGE